MFALWCANKLGNCPSIAKTRFRFTCLYCRWRRRLYGKYKTPDYYIHYTYRSLGCRKILSRCIILNGVEYTRSDGGFLTYTENRTLHIDPRGHYTRVRCAAIQVLDKIMLLTKQGKPFAEICEFLANYP